MSEEVELPDPRGDGRCCTCESRQVITRDGRFCRRCLDAILDKDTPRYRPSRAETCRKRAGDEDDDPLDAPEQTVNDWIHSIEENGSDD